MASHRLVAAPETVHWGFFDAALPPVLTVRSGDRVEVLTEPAGARQILPDCSHRVSPAHRLILESLSMGPSSHLLNGPIAIEGAAAGDALEVHFERIDLRYDWGYNTILPLKGALAEEFPYRRFALVEVDRKRRTGDWGAGVRVPLIPFFGNFGVAPPAGLGRVPSSLPGPWGGNLDNKELGTGARVLLPVFHDGALFSIGDGHGCQGDGEANSFALEMGLQGALSLTLHKGMGLRAPRARTATHHIFMGFDPILDNAVKNALQETMSFLVDEEGIGREDAYTLCSLAVDLRITQIVNGIKGAHTMLPRSLLK